MLGGGFSRLGYGKRIMVASVLAAITRIAGVGMQAVADDNVWLNLLQYAAPLAAAAWGLSQVFHQPVAAQAKAAPRARRPGRLMVIFSRIQIYVLKRVLASVLVVLLLIAAGEPSGRFRVGVARRRRPRRYRTG